MKILFFNLGSLGDRIKAWGTDGFSSIFEQDVILWGPIPDEKFIYNDKEIPIISFFEEISIKDIFKRFPENWIPDIVTCDTSVLNFVPDIYLCPVKTILYTQDAWADTIYDRSLVELFDFLNHGIIDRSFYNRFNINILPLSNCAVALPDDGIILSDFDKRDIDIISIANYDSGFYHERYKTLYNLSDSNKSVVNIKYVTGINREEINTYYQRSKIVLDWAHTLSNRSYEAALNGCLLFSHEGNPVIKEFWVPWEEYIPYNDNNVMELITYYLNNTGTTKKIIEKAYGKVRNIPNTRGQVYWENIKIAYNTEINIQERIARSGSIPRDDLYHRLATSFLYNYNYNTNFPANWKELYFKRIDSGLTNPSDNIYLIPLLIQAARMAFLLNEDELTDRYLSELERILPDYAWIWYLRARKCYKHNEIDQSLGLLQKAIDCAKRAPELLEQYVLPVNEKNNSCDNRRITDYLWQPVYGHKNEFQVKSLFHLSWELTGDTFHMKGDIKNAINSYSEAASIIPIPRCMDKLCRLALISGNYKTMPELLEKGLEDSPYYSNLVLYSALALCQTGKRHKAFSQLKEHRRALKSFNGKRRIVFIRRSIAGILILKPFGKHIISKAIIYILKVLERGSTN